MARSSVVLDGIVMGESVRWRGGELWFSDWGAGEVVRVVGGEALVVGRVEGLPFCLEWTPGGQLLVVEGRQAVVTRDGERWADLGGVDGVHPWNDVAADSRGNVFVNNIGYDFPGGEERPGIIAVVTADGAGDRSAALSCPDSGSPRDLFMTYPSENKGLEGSETGFERVLQDSSRMSKGPADLRLYMERVTGIEPAWPAWKAGALPLSYTRETVCQNVSQKPSCHCERTQQIKIHRASSPGSG